MERFVRQDEPAHRELQADAFVQDPIIFHTAALADQLAALRQATDEFYFDAAEDNRRLARACQRHVRRLEELLEDRGAQEPDAILIIREIRERLRTFEWDTEPKGQRAEAGRALEAAQWLRENANWFSSGRPFGD